MKITLVGLVAAAMLYGCGDKGLDSSHITVEKVQRYSFGKVLNLNRLHVYWSRNGLCDKLGSKYGNTTGDLVYDNIRNIVSKQDSDFFEQGFGDGDGLLHMPAIGVHGSAQEYFELKRSYVVESALPESSLVEIGQKIYTCACNDVK